MSKQVIIHRGNLGSGRILCGAREQREYHGWSKNWVLEKEQVTCKRCLRILHGYGKDDLTGQRFGLLSVVGREWPSLWRVKCDCGCEIVMTRVALTSKHTKSCGCLITTKGRLSQDVLRARGRAISLAKTVHGESEPATPEFKAWSGMKNRCLNPRYIRYAEWGGRGITVCEKWISSYEAFLADVGRRPSPRHSLDRYPDNNGNYEPGNVRWATPEEQSRNRRPRRWYKKPAEAEAVNA